MKTEHILKLSRGEVHILENCAGSYAENCKIITIAPHNHNMDEMDTFIHEALHYSMPTLPEKKVELIAGDITKILWEAGYRRGKYVKAT
jgi:TPP-dependent 2-oxoacid decarboxylase